MSAIYRFRRANDDNPSMEQDHHPRQSRRSRSRHSLKSSPSAHVLLLSDGRFNSIAPLFRAVHAEAVETEQPDHEAYGRVTNPERYQIVVDAARDRIDDLVESYQVESDAGEADVDFPDWASESAPVVRLRPVLGAPLAFMFTDFPGVVVRVGEWGIRAFPACGCDACDEPPKEVVERMNDFVDAAIEGTYEEQLTKRTLTHRYPSRRGALASERQLEHGEWKQFGSPTTHSWPAWPDSTAQ
jgi:hypothetical protein